MQRGGIPRPTSGSSTNPKILPWREKLPVGERLRPLDYTAVGRRPNDPGGHVHTVRERRGPMKKKDRRRTLSAGVMSGGLVIPAAVAGAAALDMNLVVNGTFENVDTATTGGYGGPLILDWTGMQGFAYSHDGSSTGAGVVPDYADGHDPP